MSRKLTVVKGGPPAEPPQRSYADFEKWQRVEYNLCRLGHKISERIEALEENPTDSVAVNSANGILLSYSTARIQRMLDEYQKGYEWYERDELYDCDEDGHRHIKHHVIAKHVAALLGSFPVAPHSPEVFVKRMIEEIVVADPSATQLEKACRKTIRQSKFPDISSLLEALEYEDDGFSCGIGDLTDEYDGETVIQSSYRDLEKLVSQVDIAKREAEALKCAHTGKVSRFNVGDRVSHYRYGAGSVVSLFCEHVTVKFDDRGTKRTADEFLEPMQG
jgi:hypothetical protein